MSYHHLFPFHPLQLDGKTLDCKEAVPARIAKNAKALPKHRKLFIGGVSSTVDRDDLTEYFTTFGGVESAMVMQVRSAL